MLTTQMLICEFDTPSIDSLGGFLSNLMRVSTRDPTYF